MKNCLFLKLKRIIFSCVTLFMFLTASKVFGVNYSIGTMDVVTFTEPATYNGSSVQLTSSDSLNMAGGTLSVIGTDAPYSALIGTGTGIQTGFAWGTGGTIDLGTDVTLNVNVPAGTSSPLTVIPLTQNGNGTLNLTSTDSLNLGLTQNNGTLNVTGALNTLGTVKIAGILTTIGNFTTNSNTGVVDVGYFDGIVNVGGEYTDNADQTNVNGTLTAQTANFINGGLDVGENGTFDIEEQAIFSTNTAIINQGSMYSGDNSQFHSTTVSDSGSMTLGDNTVFTGVLGCSGSITANGDIEFNYVSTSGNISIAGDAIFDETLTGYSGSVTVNQNATFKEAVELLGGTNLLINETATFNDTLDISDGAKVEIDGNLTSFNNITLTDGSLISEGNINTTGTLSTSGNSTIGLSTRLSGTELGDLSAGTLINLASTTVIQTDLSNLTAGGTPTLLVHMTAGDSTNDFQVDGAPTDTSTVGNFFGTSTLLRKIYAVDNGTGYDIYGSLQSLGDYAQNEGLDKPAIDAGNSLDDLINNTTPSDPTYEMTEDLLNQTDKNVINQTLYNLASGYGLENIFALTLVNLGQAGSPFFFGKATGLPENEKESCPCCHRTNCRRAGKCVEIWGAPFYQSIKAFQNVNRSGFNISETGFAVGVRKQYTEKLTAGLLFAYGDPNLHQGGGLQGYDAYYYSKIDLDDYQFAGHLEYENDNRVRFALFAGGGAQRLKLRRNAWSSEANDIEMNQSFTGNTDGNTLSITGYITRPFDLNDRLTLSPIIGIDCMYQWLYGFGENSEGTVNWQDMTNLSEGNFYSPVQYGRVNYHRIMARLGFSGEYKIEKGGLAFQAVYGTQLGDRDYAIVPIRTLGGAYNGRIYGYGPGRDSLNLGGGLWRYLNSTETMKASVNYNYFTLSRAELANTTAAFSWKY